MNFWGRGWSVLVSHPGDSTMTLSHFMLKTDTGISSGWWAEVQTFYNIYSICAMILFSLLLLSLFFVQIFSTPCYHPKSKPFVDHVFSFSVEDNRIWFRNFQVNKILNTCWYGVQKQSIFLVSFEKY